MDEIKQRLEDTSKVCLEAYGAWAENKKDAKAQEELHVAIHELRKVSSRLEIDLASCERDQMTSKPLPIPSHKSTGKGRQSNGNSDNGGSDAAQGGDAGAPVVQKTRRRRTPRKEGGSAEG